MVKRRTKHGLIATAVAALVLAAHTTHFPLLMLSFFGFVSATLTEQLWFRIFAGAVGVASIVLFVIVYRRRCTTVCCDDSKMQ